MCIYDEKRDPTLVIDNDAAPTPPIHEVAMVRRRVAVITAVLASLALAACSDATGPSTTPDKQCGITLGSGICAPK